MHQRLLIAAAVRRGLLAVFFIAAFVSQAYAVVTYTYTGSNYTNVTDPPFSTSMSVTGSFTLANPLAANLPGLTDISALVLSYTFSDGIATFTDATADIRQFEFATGPSGEILRWRISFEFPFPSPTQIDDILHSMGTANNNIVILDFGLIQTCTAVSGNVCTATDDVFGNTSLGRPVGTWSVSTASVPEPGSLFLLLSGIAGLGFLKRCQKVRARIK